MAGSQKRERCHPAVGHFNKEEKALLDSRIADWKDSNEALQYGDSVSAFIRYSTIGEGAQKLRKRRISNRYKLPEEKMLLQIKAELNKSGNNLNQIAKKINSGRDPKSHLIVGALREWQAVSKKLNKLLGVED